MVVSACVLGYKLKNQEGRRMLQTCVREPRLCAPGWCAGEDWVCRTGVSIKNSTCTIERLFLRGVCWSTVPVQSCLRFVCLYAMSRWTNRVDWVCLCGLACLNVS